MKRIFKNGVYLTVLMLMLLSLIPLQIMAEETIIKNESTQTTEGNVNNQIEVNELSVNVDFSTNFKDGFKVNYIQANRVGDNVVFKFSYTSNGIGSYSFFNPPNGDAINKNIIGGIKPGTNISELKLTLAEFKQVLLNDNITMGFGINNVGSFIFFSTPQLSSLATQEELDNITEEVLPTNISLNKTSVNLEVGSNDQLSTIISPSNATNRLVAWSSSNSNVATVDSNGNIRGIMAGTATITATSANNLSSSCFVTITAPNNDVNGNVEFSSEYKIGFKVNSLNASRSGNMIIFTLNYNSPRNSSYSFFNPPNGSNLMKDMANGITAGTHTTELQLSLSEFKKVMSGSTITMKFATDSNASYIIFRTAQLSSLASQDELDNITEDILPTNITLNKTTLNLVVGSSDQLSAIINPRDVTNGSVTWTSSNTSVVSVDSNGNISAIKAGSAKIIATTINNLTSSCNVTVSSTDAPNSDFSYASIDGGITIRGYNGTSKEIVIPSTIDNKKVLEINSGAFAGDFNLEKITIPDGVTHIGDYAFAKCPNLTSISLPNSITTMGVAVFRECSSLMNVDLPDSLTYIDNSTFDRCTNLTAVDIPDTVNGFGSVVFNNCSKLTSINIPDSVLTIGDSTFNNCSSLTSINIPKNVTSIGSFSFYGCKNLESIQFNSSETSIASDADFIPIKTKIIGYDPSTAKDYAAKYNRPFEKISTQGDISNDFKYTAIDGGICITEYIGDGGDILLPSSIDKKTVLKIGAWAFSDCSTLSSIKIPDNVEIIEEGAFSGCVNLKSIDLPNSITYIGDGAFRLCSSLISISLPDNIITIGEGAFYSCSKLTTFTIPSKITTIYANTFKDCTKLSSIIVPKGINLVGNAAFQGCLSLSSIEFESATTRIVDFSNIIPDTTKIIGYDPSTAKDYADKYNRSFVVIGSSENPGEDQGSISYQTHVQDVGWQELKNNGQMSGTSGRSLRLEGIKIQLNNFDNLGVTYQTHIQSIGWEANTNRGWKSDGEMSGTEGLSYRLEAIQIKLTGTNAENYDIYYQVHAQNVGWMGWAKNGESAGTAGYGYRLEGIQIKVVPKGEPAPSDNVTYPNPFKENIESPYSSILQEYRVAEANGFSQAVIKTLPNVNTELYGSSYKTKLYYILEDISGDSSPELVIAMYNPKYNNSVHPNDFQIYDVYRLNNGAPERIFDIYTMGYRSIYTICENQIIRCYGSGGINAHGDTFYKLDGNTATTIQNVTYDNPYYILNDAKNNNRTITKAEADRIINSYVPRTDINWIKL